MLTATMTPAAVLAINAFAIAAVAFAACGCELVTRWRWRRAQKRL